MTFRIPHTYNGEIILLTVSRAVDIFKNLKRSLTATAWTMRFSLVLLSVCIATAGVSQPVKPDTSFLASSRAIKIQAYNALIGGQSRLYNGIEYPDYYSHNDEHPYFLIDDWGHGNVVYDDEFYGDVDLFYDLSKDAVITEHKLTGGKIQLISNKVSRFTLNDHLFVRLAKDKAGVIGESFYEVLYDGKVKVYARRQKWSQSRADVNGITYYFSTINWLYILKDGVYTQVKSKKSVYGVFKDHRKDLTGVLRTRKVRYRKERERSVVILAEEYDRQSK
jgi:hypothetical protein